MLAVSLAELRHEVTAININEGVVDAINSVESPIQEPGVDDLVVEHSGPSLYATTSYESVGEGDITFSAI